MNKITTTTLKKMKENGEKITVLTSYDTPTTKILNDLKIDVVLVGDSVGNVKLGYENTIPVTMEEMLHHTKAVKRGNSTSLLVADLPYLSYQMSIQDAKVNAGRLIKEGGAEAIKLEGGTKIASTIKALSEIQVPVMGHLGLTPQSIHALGGYKIQGKTSETQEKMIQDALALEKAGAFAIVLECIPSELGRMISQEVSIPTIGIGAGPDCDGQVLVIDDLLGLTLGPVPKFVKPYANLKESIVNAVNSFKEDVKKNTYLSDINSESPTPRSLEKNKQ